MVWRGTIADFLRAVRRRRSFDPRRNPYLIFGFLWGLPIPLFSVLLGYDLAGLPVRLSTFPTLLHRQPWQAFFLVHPLLFALIFGVLGTLYLVKEEQVARLLRDLRGKVRELNAANQDLRVLDKMKDEFLSNVTHELKTPLVTIQGYSEMLSSERLGQITEKQRKALDVMQRNQHRLIELIDQLLRYGRMEERGGQLFKGAVPLRKLMGELRQSFAPIMAAKGIRFEVVPPERDLHVLGEEDLIEQVFINLLGNARKFTESGKNIYFYVDEAEGPERIGVIVEDEGCGIAPDALPLIFKRFWQSDGSSSRKHGGTGLGLAIVKRILDAHRAPIHVESKLGEGTRFTVSLPLAYGGREGPPAETRRTPS